MSILKRVICLAHSWKHNGRCFAGREVKGPAHAWVRPVSDRGMGELSQQECQYATGGRPRLLDALDIAMLRPCPKDYQRENHLIDPAVPWEKLGACPPDALDALLDSPESLWLTGEQLTKRNDRIAHETACTFSNSLVLIRPDATRVRFQKECKTSGQPRIRAYFEYLGTPYALAVTDAVAERRFLWQPKASPELDEVRLCVSLGEPFEGFCYKLVAGVICRELLESAP